MGFINIFMHACHVLCSNPFTRYFPLFPLSLPSVTVFFPNYSPSVPMSLIVVIANLTGVT